MRYLCEYLSRINSLSVCLESEYTIEKITTGQNTIKIDSEFNSQVVLLGIPIANHTLHPHNKEVSLRVPTAERYTPHNWQFIVPWQAKDLQSKRINCLVCQKPLKFSGSFKQLPSEYWAELMEFWHCHKPQETHEHNKNYNITFEPQPQQPLVSDTYIKYHKDDISCEHLDPAKVWKWQVKVNDESINSHVFIAAMLRELVNSHAIFSFLIENESTNQSILIWIFNVEAQYTLTDSVPCKGLKVYFSTEKSQYPSLMNQRGEVETVTLPDLAVKELSNELNRTNGLTPTSLAHMGEFKLGFVSDSI